MTEGSIGKRLALFFLPIAAGTMFQQLYNAADAFIVGRFVGTVALAAVGGSAAMIINVMLGFFVALSGGAGVIIAQFFGARDEESMKRATGTAVAFCLIAGVGLTAVGWLSAPLLLRLLKSPADTMADSVIYLRIVFFGVTATLLYNVEAGILRAVGDSRSPFLYLLSCCLTNIVLDLLLVAVFGMGVAGAAIATVFSQLLSAVLSTCKLLRSHESYRINPRGIRIDRLLLRSMLHIGIPAGLQSSMYSVSNLILQVAVNVLGTTVVAAWTLSGKVDGMYWAFANAAGIAVTTFSAQNYGAGRMDRVREGTKLSLRLFLLITLGFTALLLTLGPKILHLFSSDAEVIAATWEIMLYIVPFYFTWTFIEVLSGVLRGVGDAVVPAIICGVGICLLRVLWVLTVCRIYPGLPALCICYPVSWIATDVAFIIRYRSGRWQREKVRI